MALQIDLKPGEKCIVSGAVIRNYKNVRVQFAIENGADVCVLRENSIMTPEEADTPCKNLYFVIQLMYIDAERRHVHLGTFTSLVNEIKKAAPSLSGLMSPVEEYVKCGSYYKALRQSRELIDAEKELLEEAAIGKHDI